ncbi:hypothetical protein CAPTEDRAFT_213544 [Capitella teleta]|uniref:Uncharacterized protein n=1 Tax=Capitella teleta TaxID=283909 RepID=R7VC57_CAPTE|nr:hypothetical protein CAPTEDRAFT_213544 [Capitella teleta]|eukprot:ELU16184.1 hypothetical protein CAPTEDRAFT_213544 [Capitella teleta]
MGTSLLPRCCCRNQTIRQILKTDAKMVTIRWVILLALLSAFGTIYLAIAFDFQVTYDVKSVPSSVQPDYMKEEVSFDPVTQLDFTEIGEVLQADTSTKFHVSTSSSSASIEFHDEPEKNEIKREMVRSPREELNGRMQNMNEQSVTSSSSEASVDLEWLAEREVGGHIGQREYNETKSCYKICERLFLKLDVHFFYGRQPSKCTVYPNKN